MNRGLYSVVQYVPDGGRAEAANAGVVLFVPSLKWLDVRVSPSLERIRQFFRPGRSEMRRIELAVEAFKNRMELARTEFHSENDLAIFAAARADFIRLTPPRVIMVDEPGSALEPLYVELVGDIERSISNLAHAHVFPPAVAEVFGRLEAQRRIWRPGKITLPSINRPFEVSAAFQNGRVNYVRPESLAPSPKLDDRLAKLGFNGQLIYRHGIDSQKSQLVILSANANADPQVERRFGATLEEFSVRFVPYHESQKFAEEVEQTAHQ